MPEICITLQNVFNNQMFEHFCIIHNTFSLFSNVIEIANILKKSIFAQFIMIYRF